MKTSKTAPKKKSRKRTASLTKCKKPARQIIQTWQQARQFVLQRTNIFGEKEKLERGVNFFVLMLEKLGAITEFSCEGHPTGFYIVFYAPIEVAQKLVYCGFFSVELEGRFNALVQSKIHRWSLRCGPHVNTAGVRKSVLTMAAKSWHDAFGDIEFVTGVENASRRND